MNLTESIESAEHIFKQILEDFFTSVYDEKNLLSHGIDHHRRVWRYARELLITRLRQSGSTPSCKPSELIAACYLHDIGMSVETGPRHGKQSRDLCLQFINRYNLQNGEWENVLATIENHDNKDYTAKSGNNDLLTVLSVADDLDAFGLTGIYRYSEIYLARGIDPGQMGHLILENAKRRFKNFENIFISPVPWLKFHRKRYEILTRFFRQYNKQAETYDFLSADPIGYCGVIQLFMSLLGNKMTLKDFFAVAEINYDDRVMEAFLRGLKSELISNFQNNEE